MNTLPVKAIGLFADDNRGIFVLIKIKPFKIVKSVAIALSDLNTDRLYKILGKFDIPLVTAEARATCAKQLQIEVAALIHGGDIKPITVAKCDHLEQPLM
jgi:hypothetical protein